MVPHVQKALQNRIKSEFMFRYFFRCSPDKKSGVESQLAEFNELLWWFHMTLVLSPGLLIFGQRVPKQKKMCWFHQGSNTRDEFYNSNNASHI